MTLRPCAFIKSAFALERFEKGHTKSDDISRVAILLIQVYTMYSILAINALAWCAIKATSLRVFVPVLLLAALATTLKKRLSKPSDHIPEVRYGWPIVGNVIAYSKDSVAFLRKATAQHSNIFKMNMIFTTVVWLRSPKYNKIYLETKEVRNCISPLVQLADRLNNAAYLVFWGRHSMPLEAIFDATNHSQGIFLNKIVSPGYFDNLKTFVGSLSRGINRTAALDHYSHLARDTAQLFLADWEKKEEIDLFEHVSKLVHAIIVQCLMGPDFYTEHGEELYNLLHNMEADIGSVFNLILPDWVPHPAARRLRQQRDRLGTIFRERLKERSTHPEKWNGSLDYISYTLNDSVTAHLSHYYASHHTMLMFAAHTSTVASISWTILEVKFQPLLPCYFFLFGMQAKTATLAPKIS